MREELKRIAVSGVTTVKKYEKVCNVFGVKADNDVTLGSERPLSPSEFNGGRVREWNGTPLYTTVLPYKEFMKKYSNKETKLKVKDIVLVCDTLTGDWKKRELLTIRPKGLKFRYVTRSATNKDILTMWVYCKAIPQVEKMTLAQVYEELGREVKIVQ